MIVDTCFIIDLMEEKESAVQKLKKISDSKTIISIGIPSIVELWSGAVRSSNAEKELLRIATILDSQKILSLDESSAKIAGIVDGILRKKGERIGVEDSMIAGIALTKSLPVLSNDKHFKRIKGLTVESY